MKKVLFIVLIACSLNSFGQFKIGPRIAGEVYWLGILKQKKKDGNFISGPLFESYSIGITSEIKINNKLSIVPEVLFNKSHGSSAYVDHLKNDTVFLNISKINQIQIPVLLKVTIKNMYVLIGPSASELNKSSAVDKKHIYFDAGINAGIGVKIPETNLNIDLRYYRGFASLDNIGYHQNYINIGISYLLSTIRIK